MRQLITIDKNGHIMGEFPHNPLEGFKSGRRGLRRRLVPAKEVEVLGPETAMALAHERYNLREKQLREEQFIEDERKRQLEHQRRNMPVSEAAKRWRADLEVTNAERTVRTYMATIQVYLEHVGDHPLREFSRAHNIQFLDALRVLPSQRHPDRTITPATQHMHVRQLNNFLRWAYDNEHIDKLHRLKKPKLPEKEMEVFSLAQLQQLKQYLLDQLDNALPGRPAINARNNLRAFMLATNCLMRVGAIAALPLKNIDLDARLIKIRDVPELDWKNKASKWPNKPINQRLYDFIKEDLANRGPNERWFLDDGNGNTWYSHYGWVSKSMTKAVKAAGLPDGVKPFHWGMRAAMITWLLNNGESPQKVQQLADHADLQTTMKYYNTREASQRSAVERLPEI